MRGVDKVKAKIICIIVMTLLITTALPSVGTMTNKDITVKPISTSTVVWSDNFDSYTAGNPLNGQGGWDTWDLDPQLTCYVSDNYSHSPSNSMELNYKGYYWTDMVHLFYGIDSGVWNLTVWQYVPGTMMGHSVLHLFHTYEHGKPHSQSHLGLALQANIDTGKFCDWRNGNSLPLIIDEWVKIRVEIDFEQDIVTAYYNDTLLESISWSSGGEKKLACINPNNEAIISSDSYFDDFSLEGEIGTESDLHCYGELDFGKVKPGATVEDNFIVQNQGISLLDWEINETPEWGEWSFEPNEGTDLGPYEPVTVNVQVVAPNEKDTFTGKLKIVNSENPDDYEIINIKLSTSRDRTIQNPFLNWLHSHPNMFPILRQLLGL